MSERFTRAIARRVANTFSHGLTKAALGVPDLELARAQHAAYCDVLRDAGVAVTVLDADDAYPDSTFVEDTAIVSAGRAIVTRPGAAERLGEAQAMRAALSPFFAALDAIEPPGTVDGGDVCEAGDRAYVGLSARTNRAGAEQLAAWFARGGVDCTIVDIRDLERTILHLKSGLAYAGDATYVAIAPIAARVRLEGDVVVAGETETYAANCVRVNDVVLLPSGYPELQSTLERRGFQIVALDVSEFRKMDGGLSCLSVRF